MLITTGAQPGFCQAGEIMQNRGQKGTKEGGGRFFRKQGKPHKNERTGQTGQGSPHSPPPPGCTPWPKHP